jgi:hypothetical protein
MSDFFRTIFLLFFSIAIALMVLVATAFWTNWFTGDNWIYPVLVGVILAVIMGAGKFLHIKQAQFGNKDGQKTLVSKGNSQD